MVDVVPVRPRIGAEIRGVRLNDLSGEDFNVIYRAFLDHGVIAIRDQTLTIDEFLAYSRRFGVLKPHISRKTRHPDYPELTVMGVNAVKPTGEVNKTIHKRGTGWHTDLPYETIPAKATQLYGIEIPTHGGDTLFSDMYAAYDALPERLKTRVEGMRAAFRYGGRTQQGVDLLDEADRDRPPAIHPIVRTHPETGRKALYVNPVHILDIVGLDPKESDELLQELFRHMLQPDCDYRHKWRAGDVVIWDNRRLIHSATGDHPPDQKRIHWRVTIMDYGYKAEAPRAA